jgi:hypothetical protein
MVAKTHALPAFVPIVNKVYKVHCRKKIIYGCLDIGIATVDHAVEYVSSA